MCVIKPQLSTVNIFKSGFEESVQYYQNEFLQESNNYDIYERDRYFMDPPKVDNVNSGLKRLKQFEFLTENGFKDKLSRFQREFMLSMIKAEVEHIIGEDQWTQVGPSLIKERGWDTRKKITIGSA